MKPIHVFRLLFLGMSLLLGAAVVRAEDLSNIKARMERRQSTILGLEDRGLVGEDNRGYLAPRGALAADQSKAVSEENTDRASVYAAIASQTGSSSEAVGQARAAKIAAHSRAGVWIQAADGNWAKKG